MGNTQYSAPSPKASNVQKISSATPSNKVASTNSPKTISATSPPTGSCESVKSGSVAAPATSVSHVVALPLEVASSPPRGNTASAPSGGLISTAPGFPVCSCHCCNQVEEFNKVKASEKVNDYWRRTLQILGDVAQRTYIHSISENATVNHATLLRKRNGFQLWRAEEGNPFFCRFRPVYFVGSRGTYLLTDIQIDWHLLRDRMGRASNCQAKMEDAFTSIEWLLAEAAVPFDASLVYCGHSLGGSRSEYAYWKKLRESAPGSYPNSMLVTFDSAGLSEEFRQRNDMPTQDMPRHYAYNAQMNIVNTLNRSNASVLFTCGQGSQVPAAKVLAALGMIGTNAVSTTFRFFWNWFATNTRSHTLEYMCDKVWDASGMRVDDPMQWWETSAYLASACNKVMTVGDAMWTAGGWAISKVGQGFSWLSTKLFGSNVEVAPVLMI